MAIRTILDTDIGTDVDDCLALALLLASPEARVEAITCVYGDVGVRSRMVHELLRLAGRLETPVFEGCHDPLLRQRPVYWAGHEGRGLLDDAPPPPPRRCMHAASAMVDVARSAPGEVRIVAIGPLTNVALALLLCPELPELVRGITIMGGAVAAQGGVVEHNFGSDPEAADLVIRSGAAITLVPLDVTRRVAIDPAGVYRIRAAGTPFHEAVARQVELYPRFARDGATFLHDPLTVAAAIRPELLETTRLPVRVETESGERAGALQVPTGGDEGRLVDVATQVDVGAFSELFLERVSRPSIVVA